MLSQGLLHALQSKDDAALARLLWTAPTRPVERLNVVTLGVGKKVAQGSFCAFDFRLRDVTASTPTSLSWSCVFPLKPDNQIPAEGFLQFPQKQKFNPVIFLEQKVLTITNALVADDAAGGGRITLTDTSTVTPGAPFTEWTRFQAWSPEPFLKRVRQHEPGPFDLEVELQDEVILHDWTIDAPSGERDGQTIYPVVAGQLSFDAVVSSGSDGAVVRKHLDELKTAETRPPLFGLLHFERARFILQPYALLEPTGPKLITISTEAVDSKALLKTLKF